MASLIKQKKSYYLQFYDSDRTPSRKKVSLGVRLKHDAERLQARLEALYAEGCYDPSRLEGSAPKSRGPRPTS